MYKKNSECEEMVIEDAVVIRKQEDNSLHVLNETAALIWDCIEKISVDDIIEQIMLKYEDVDIEMVKQDVFTAIDKLADKGLIILQ